MTSKPWALSAPPELSDDEFEAWRALLEERTGINFNRHRKILHTGLVQRLHELNENSFSEYFEKVKSGVHGAAEWEALLNKLTVKETRFFRDPDAYRLAKAYIQKFLLKDNKKSIEVWSAASSTGEEAYSLGMLLSDCTASLPFEKYFGVTATDICLSTLSLARQGVYTKRKLNVLSERMRGDYFDEHEQYFTVKDDLKNRVCFVQANLVQMQTMPISGMDIIYCQNVLIYFSKETQYKVLDELAQRLKPNGLLIIGMAEAFGWENKTVKRIKDEKVQAFIKLAS